jgi:cell division septal protein FtsQ
MYERGYKPLGHKKQKKPRRLLTRILFWLVLIAILVGVSVALRHPSLQIVTVDVEGVEVLDSEIIKADVTQYLDGKVLWLFPRSSVFLASSKKIEARVKQISTRIQRVEIEKPSFTRMSIRIIEYKPSYVWCRYDDQSKCFFMTDSGVVYAEAPQFSGSVYTKVITGPEEALPFQALASSDLEKIVVYKRELPKRQIYPEVFMYSDGRTLTIIASTKTNPNTEIFVLSDASVETILDSIVAVFRTPEFLTQYQAGKKLLYIDLRTKNRVVYRFE